MTEETSQKLCEILQELDETNNKIGYISYDIKKFKTEEEIIKALKDELQILIKYKESLENRILNVYY